MRNGSGNYTPPNSSWSPAVNGILATSGDWTALLNDISAALTQSVSRDGQSPMIGDLPMGNNKITGLSAANGSGQALAFQQLFDQGVMQDIASAATTDIGLQNTNFLRVTGNTTITSFGSNFKGPRFLVFEGAVTLTNSSTLVLPGGANITTAAGDVLIAIPGATLGTADKWIVTAYQKNAVPGSVLPQNQTSKIEPVTGSVASNALTVTLNPTALDFRSATIGSGTVNTRTIGTAISAVVPSGATLGTTNAVLSKVTLIALDNAGTVELAVCNGSLSLDESTLISTTVLDAASDSATVIYSTTVRTNVPFRIVGYIESTQATAGTWATAPSKIQGYGGQAIQQDVKAALNATGSAPIYACRAWVNFNGTGTVAIRASGNVTSITDNGTGEYTVNFTTAMPDINYGAFGQRSRAASIVNSDFDEAFASRTTSSSRWANVEGGGLADASNIQVVIFR